MTSAFIFLTTEIGAEQKVSTCLKKINEIKEVYSLWGVYDIVAYVKTDNMDELKQVINNNVNRINGINSKLTLLLSEDKPMNSQEQLISMELGVCILT